MCADARRKLATVSRSAAPPPHPDVLLATVVRFLLDGGEERTAQVVMACEIDMTVSIGPGESAPLAEAAALWRGEAGSHTLWVTVTGDRAVYDAIEHYKPFDSASVGPEMLGAFRAAWKDLSLIHI